MMDSPDEMVQRLQKSHHTSGSSGFISWLRHPQRGLPYLICSILVILVILPFLIHYYLSSVVLDEQTQVTSVHGTRLDRVNRFGSTKASELKLQIDELRNIRLSVSNELLELERKRQALLSEITGYTTAIEGLKVSYQSSSEELNRLKISFANLQVEQKELLKNNLPNIEAPLRILPVVNNYVNDSLYAHYVKEQTNCDIHSCFDYSRCSVTSQFPVYVYPFEASLLSEGVDVLIKDSVTYAFGVSPYITHDPNVACIYVVVINDKVLQTVDNSSVVDDLLRQLPYWGSSGLNHVLMSLVQSRKSSTKQVQYINTGAAMVAQSHFSKVVFRPMFDVVMPAALGISHGDVWDQLPMLIPARRKYLLTFVGEIVLAKMQEEIPSVGGSLNSIVRRHSVSSVGFEAASDEFIVDVLKKLAVKYASDGFYFNFICRNEKVSTAEREWTLCGTETQRSEVLQKSTFSLLIAPTDLTLVSTSLVQTWLFELLKSGAIPVILGDYVRLPFDEIINWSRAVIKLPKARITELHFVLRSYTDADILEMRRQGRIIYETFFGSVKSVVDSMLAVIRRRLFIPAFPLRDEASPNVFNETFVPLYETVMESVLEADEMLGPVEPPLASPRYYRNFTFETNGFLIPGDPFHSFPYTPFEPVMPADAKFVGSSYGFRPIGQGAGGAGKEFSEALGGNIAREQFTVIILTYEREAVLINAISRLKGLPHVNKVVVVWNSPHPPAEDLRWPDIGVKIHVIKTAKNSLNNRFLPYDTIETEAVLSVDDDAHLRHDEIMFGFRIWREARDRIVGFPGRFNSWDMNHQNWLYNSNYSCELSMVLTGAAFIHKYYFYVYSYIMPQAIRDKVDEYLNCEDLAMNFLVSHITRKPPIKVTSRWTFRCPGCPKALSVEESHFNERHKCVNFFVRVYGYMPLLNTQFRADSVLFKTRIPHDKQKCFKFI